MFSTANRSSSLLMLAGALFVLVSIVVFIQGNSLSAWLAIVVGLALIAVGAVLRRRVRRLRG